MKLELLDHFLINLNYDIMFCKLSFVRLFLYSGKVENFKPIEKYKTKSRMSWIGLKNFYHQIIAI